jgi:prepilin-type N-terminal cleavage/methylation domain-containing protein
MTNILPIEFKNVIGFTLIELLVVISIIAMLAIIGYPLARSEKPDLSVKNAVVTLEGLMDKGRLKAATLNRPTRVVVNCGRSGGFESCFADLQTAEIKNAEVTDWRRSPPDRRVLDKNVNVVKKSPSLGHDGKLSFKGIYWSIFTPGGLVYSDPKPLNLFVYHDSQPGKNKKGWNIKIDASTGRVESTRGNLSSP